MENLKKDALWVAVISIAVVAVVVGTILASERLRQSNDTKVIVQFVYEQLNECNRKLAAYGEDVELDIPRHKTTAKDLTICLEKLGAYGEDTSIPANKNKK